MADEKNVNKEAEPKKGKKGKEGKKGKLPVLIALVAVLGGGGFFGLKMAGGKPKVEVAKMSLGDSTHVLSLGEFMVNTTDGEAFLRATVFVHMADKTSLLAAEAAHGETASVESMAPYIDAVREVLATQKRRDLQAVDGELKVKTRIAQAINALYRQRNPEAASKLPKPDGEEHTDWHTQDGPVLVVYFSDYVWE